jgi:hypothetical protein
MDDKTKLTRRGFFRSAATLAGAAVAAGVIPIRVVNAQQKLAKDAMKYQDTPKDGQECDQCVYWQPPEGCGLVEGKISPKGWCVAFNKKK